MKDYTKEIEFWKRLQRFVSDVQTGCCAGEEEKEMIIHNCKLKILEIQHVSICTCGTEQWAEKEPRKDGETYCGRCGFKY